MTAWLPRRGGCPACASERVRPSRIVPAFACDGCGAVFRARVRSESPRGERLMLRTDAGGEYGVRVVANAIAGGFTT
jgi:hypothetical protein